MPKPTLAARSLGAKLRVASAEPTRIERPSSYSPELAEAICNQIADGKTMYEVCRQRDMPSSLNVYRWLDEQPDFARNFRIAREAHADCLDHRIKEIIENCTPETVSSDRVKLAALQWRASKLSPKRYGDHQRTPVSGDRPIQVVLRGSEVDEAAEAYQQALQKRIDEVS